jgi:hypothetical protein
MAVNQPSDRRNDVLPRGVDWRSVGLWTGLLAGPFVDLVDVTVSEAYVEHVETGVQRAWLLAFAALGALVCVAAGAIAASIGRRVEREPEPPDGLPRERIRFMSTGGVVLSAFSLFVLLAMLVPKLLATPAGAP